MKNTKIFVSNENITEALANAENVDTIIWYPTTFDDEHDHYFLEVINEFPNLKQLHFAYSFDNDDYLFFPDILAPKLEILSIDLFDIDIDAKFPNLRELNLLELSGVREKEVTIISLPQSLRKLNVSVRHKILNDSVFKNYPLLNVFSPPPRQR